MSLWRIAWKNMRQRGVASSLTVLSMALGVAVMVAVIVVHAVAVKQFSSDAQGYHLIVGGKGGDLQLVLSTVYHLGESRYTLPYSFYREFIDGEYADHTEVAVPYCMGDSFDPNPTSEGPSGDLFRVVATTPDLFDKIEYGTRSDGIPLPYTFSSGENFHYDRPFEAVLGSVVAARSGVKVGDTINPTHGISGRGDRHDAFLVTGILDPTGTANDRAVFVNIEGFYLLDGHSLSKRKRKTDLPPLVLGSHAASRTGKSKDETLAVDGADYEVVAALAETGTDVDDQAYAPLDSFTLPAIDQSEQEDQTAAVPFKLYDNDGNELEPLPVPQREVSSILVLCSNMMGPTSLTTRINKDQNRSAQAVAPARVVANLLEGIVGPMQLVLLVLTVLIVVVASISILVSIYNSMSERSHDIAVMRALGASRTSVMLIVLSESILLSIAGGVLGILLGHGLIAAAAPYVEAQSGVRLAFWEFDPWELAVAPTLVLLATLSGLLPAVSAYRTDVAHSL